MKQLKYFFCKIILLVLIIILLFSCNDRTIMSKYIYNKIDVSDRRIYMPVSIKDTTLLFMFDTGAEVSVISEKMAKRLNLNHTMTQVYPMKVAGIQKNARKSATTLQLCENELGVPMYVTDLESDAILGMDLIKEYFWHIDFREKKISFSKSKITISKKADLILKYKLINSRPCVQLSLFDGKKYWFVLDTGWNFDMDLLHINDYIDSEYRYKESDNAYKKLLNDKTIKYTLIQMSDNQEKLYNFDQMKIGENYMPFFSMRLAQAGKNDITSGFIGIGFFLRFNDVLINPFNKTVSFFVSDTDSVINPPLDWKLNLPKQ